MATNSLGIKNSNVIIPYSSVVQQSKWIDISSKLTITLSAGTPTTVRAYARFYADSNGMWTMEYRISSSASSASKTSAAFALPGITTANVAGNYMPCSAWIDSTSVVANTEGSVNSSTFVNVKHASADIQAYSVEGSCELKQVPTWADVATGLTATTALESVTNAAIYIPPASATESGIVTTGAQTLAGVKTFASGLKLPTSGGTATTLDFYEEYSTALTLTGFGTTGSLTYKAVRIGAVVTITANCIFNGTSIDVAPYTSALPARFRPTVDIGVPSYIDPATTETIALFLVTSAGGLNFYQIDIDSAGDLAYGASAWPAQAGARTFTVSYTIV